jgi:hypothetical protein
MFNTINSSLISWQVLPKHSNNDFFQAIYCADGDGFVELVDYGDHYLLKDQCEIVKTFTKSELEDEATQKAELLSYLELAQSYLAANYHDIFENAKHWENV